MNRDFWISVAAVIIIIVGVIWIVQNVSIT